MHVDTHAPNYRYNDDVHDKQFVKLKQVIQTFGHVSHYLLTWFPYKPVPQFCTHNLWLTYAK